MGTLQPDSEAKGEMDDSGCVQDGSPPVKKQAIEKMELLENGYQGLAHILDLSDDVLLCILKYCSPQDLKALGYTCVRLGALVRDRTLWQSVDARQQPSGRARLRWLISNVLNDGTTELLLCGYAREARGCLGHVPRARRESEGGEAPRGGDADGSNQPPCTSEQAAGTSGSAGCAPTNNSSSEGASAIGAPANNIADGAPAINIPAQDTPGQGAPIERTLDRAPVKIGPAGDSLANTSTNSAPNVDPLADGTSAETLSAVAATVKAEEAEGARLEGSPVQGASVKGAPIKNASVEGSSVKSASSEDASLENAPVEGAPVEVAPAEGAPVVRASAEGAPAEGALAGGAPVEGAPAGGAPVEGAPAGGALVEAEVDRNGRAEPPYPLARQHARLHISAQQLPRFSGAPSWSDELDPERADEPVRTDSSCCGPQFTVTQQILAELQLRCTKLTSLSLEYCNINCKKTGISHFPPTLKKLSLRGTKCFNLPLDKSFLFKIQDYLPNLEHLDVSECEWMEPASLLPLSKAAGLATLLMRDCARMTEFVAYASLATRYGFRALKVLDMRGSPVGDSEVSAFGWVPELEELYLAPASAAEEPTEEHSHFKGDALPPHHELEPWEIEEEPMYQPMLDSAESADNSLEDLEEQDDYMGSACQHGSDFNICNDGVRIEVSLRASNGDDPPEPVRQIERYNIRRRPQEDGGGDNAAGDQDPVPEPSHKRKTEEEERVGEKKAKYSEDKATQDKTEDNAEKTDGAKTEDDAKTSKGDVKVSDDAKADGDAKVINEDAKSSDKAKVSDDAKMSDDAGNSDNAAASSKQSKKQSKRKTRSMDADKSDVSPKRKRHGDVNEGASTSRTIDIRFEISRETMDDSSENPDPNPNESNDLSPNSDAKESHSDNSDDEDDGAPKKRKNAVRVPRKTEKSTPEQGQGEIQIEVQVQGENVQGQIEVRQDQNQQQDAQAPDEQAPNEQARERRHGHERRGRRGHSRRRRYENVVRFRQDQDPVIIQCPILPQRQEPEQLENQEGEPRHHILYVNVGQQLHAVYRLLPSRPIFHSMRNRNWRPNIRNVFYSPSQPHVDASSLVTDSAIRRFGRADGDHINYVNIGPNGPYPAARDAGGRPIGLFAARDLGARPDRSNLRVLSVTGYRHITDRSLVHLATAAPHLRRVDFTNTGVTERGVENFRSLRPECEVRFSEYVDKNEEDNTE